MTRTAGTVRTSFETWESDARVVHRAHVFLVIESDRPLSGGARYAIDGADEIVIARGSTRSAEFERRGKAARLVITVPGKSTSKPHTILSRRGGRWLVADAGSTNGTFLDGERVLEPAEIPPGGVVQAGHAFFVLRDSVLSDGTDSVANGDDGSDRQNVLPGFPTLVPFLEAELARVRAVAHTGDSITIVGQTGAGKEVLANAIHALSGRSGPFVGRNCATLTANLADGQLFGYIKGAYSGAGRDDPGFFGLAENGTLLLDEILELPLDVQAKLLRAVQFGEIVPLGVARAKRVNVRILAASQERLDQAVARGVFRADLHGRLDRMTVELPPLRERREDLGLLTASILRKAGAKEDDGLVLPSKAVLRMIRHDWPNNVRQLENALVRALRHSRNGILNADEFPLPDKASRSSADAPLSAVDSALLEQLRLSLTRHEGNCAAVAREMGKHREQIHRWLRRFNIDATTFRPAAT